eukprot:GHVT01002733.1.p1 GENE.GHVT01002733.1~~GHVT01002733.1.p1  ORF type:complete len:623 (+),score=45.25 GHVT01002733.1:1800-3668(+)
MVMVFYRTMSVYSQRTLRSVCAIYFFLFASNFGSAGTVVEKKTDIYPSSPTMPTATFSQVSDKSSAVWMDRFPEAKLCDLSLPATYESTLYESTGFTPNYGASQQRTIEQQLYDGIRWFDIKAFAAKDDSRHGFTWYSGVVPEMWEPHQQVKSEATLEESLFVPLYTYLDLHTTEVVIVNFDYLGSYPHYDVPEESPEDAAARLQSFAALFYQHWRKMMPQGNHPPASFAALRGHGKSLLFDLTLEKLVACNPTSQRLIVMVGDDEKALQLSMMGEPSSNTGRRLFGKKYLRFFHTADHVNDLYYKSSVNQSLVTSKAFQTISGTPLSTKTFASEKSDSNTTLGRACFDYCVETKGCNYFAFKFSNDSKTQYECSTFASENQKQFHFSSYVGKKLNNTGLRDQYKSQWDPDAIFEDLVYALCPKVPTSGSSTNPQYAKDSGLTPHPVAVTDIFGHPNGFIDRQTCMLDTSPNNIYDDASEKLLRVKFALESAHPEFTKNDETRVSAFNANLKDFVAWIVIVRSALHEDRARPVNALMVMRYHDVPTYPSNFSHLQDAIIPRSYFSLIMTMNPQVAILMPDITTFTAKTHVSTALFLDSSRTDMDKLILGTEMGDLSRAFHFL